MRSIACVRACFVDGTRGSTITSPKTTNSTHLGDECNLHGTRLHAHCHQPQPQQFNKGDSLTPHADETQKQHGVQESSQQINCAHPRISYGFCQQGQGRRPEPGVRHVPTPESSAAPASGHMFGIQGGDKAMNGQSLLLRSSGVQHRQTCNRTATHRDTMTLDACSPHWRLRLGRQATQTCLIRLYEARVTPRPSPTMVGVSGSSVH